MTKSDYKEILKRFNTNRQTQADELAVGKFANPGEPDYRQALQRFKQHHEKSKEIQTDMFFEQGLMMPLSDDNSAIPKQMMRGSLFAPITRGRRKAITDKPVATFNGGEIRFTGIQLDQGDLDLLLELNRLLSEFTKTGNVEKITDEKGRIEYTRIKFTSYSLLMKMGKTDSQGNYKRLEQSLDRLGGRLTVVIDGQGKVNGGMIGKAFIADDGMIAVDINHDYTKLFTGNNFAFIDTDKRAEISGDFAKWLQGFVSTHTGESRYSADKLIELSGSKPKRKRDWRTRQAVPAFEQLKELGLIKDFSVKGYFFKWVR